MKKLAILLLAVATVARPSTFYVSNSGDDTHAGTSYGTAWKTVGHALANWVCGSKLLVDTVGFVRGDGTIPYCAGSQINTIQSLNWELLWYPVTGYRTDPAKDEANYGKLNFIGNLVPAFEEHGSVAGAYLTAGGGYHCWINNISGGTTLTYACDNINSMNLSNGVQVEFEINAQGSGVQSNVFDGTIAVGQKLYACNVSGFTLKLSLSSGCGSPLTGLTCTNPTCWLSNPNDSGSGGMTYFFMPLQVTVGSATITIPDTFGSVWANTVPVQVSASGWQLNFTPPAPLTQGGSYTICNKSGVTFNFCDGTGTPIVITSPGTGPLAARNFNIPNNWAFHGLELVEVSGNPIFGFVDIEGDGYEIDHSYFHEVVGDSNPPQHAISDNGTNVNIHDNYISGIYLGESQGVLLCGSAGPTYITNNFFNVAGEDILAGGCSNFLGIPNSNLTVTGNYIYKAPSLKITYDSPYVLNGETAVDVGSGTTANLTYTGGQEPTVGQTSIVGCATSGSAATITASDNQGNTYTSFGSATSGTLKVQAFASVVATSMGAFTVTCTSSVSNKISITAASYHGASVTLDGSPQTATGTGTSISTSSIVTTHNASIRLLFTAGGSGGSYTAGSFGGIYSQDATATNVPMAIQADVGANTASGTPPFSAGTTAANMTGGGGTWVALALALRGTAITPTSTAWYDCYDPNHCGGEWYMDASGQWWQGQSNFTWATSVSTPSLCNSAGARLSTCDGHQMKDLSENKNVRYAKYDGNVYRFSPAGAQSGEAVNHSCEIGSGPEYSNDHITFTNNAIYNVYMFGIRVSQCGTLQSAPGLFLPTNHTYRNILTVIDPESCGVNGNTIGCGYNGAFSPINFRPLPDLDTQDHITTFTPDTGFLSTPTVTFQDAPDVINTTGMALISSTALTVANGYGLLAGQSVTGTGIAGGTLVTSVVGTSVTLSIATTSALSNTAVAFGSGCIFPPPINHATFTNNIGTGDFNGGCFPGSTMLPKFYVNSSWLNSALKAALSTYSGGGTNTVSGIAYPANNAAIHYVNGGSTSVTDHCLTSASPFSASNASHTQLSTDGTDLGIDCKMLAMLTSGVLAGTPNADAQAHLIAENYSTFEIFRYAAPTAAACTVTVFSSLVRITANQVGSTVADSAASSLSDSTDRQLLFTGLTASTPYWYELACGSGAVMVGSFSTKGTGSGTYTWPFNFSTARAMRYSTSATMSSPTTLGAATTQNIPVTHAQGQIYAQQQNPDTTWGSITIVAAP